MKNIAIIPARGGSKRIPRKNIKLFMGKPIIAYSIEVAQKSNLFDEIMVSTEDEEIAGIALQYGANVPFMRSIKAANDFAPTADVIIEVLNTYASMGKTFDIVSCIYPTAPFVSKELLHEAYNKLITYQLNSIFPLVAFSHPIQRSLTINESGFVEMKKPEYLNSRSQDLATTYFDAGQFYMAIIDAFFEYKTFWGEKTGGIILNELQVQDLDNEMDWKLAELKYKLLHNL